MENEVLKAIRQRRSYRKYKPEQITDEELQTVLDAGTWAPTGMGKQDPYIVAVQNPELCDELRRMNAEVMGTTSDPFYGAPTIVLVFGSADWSNQVKDGSLVLGTMILAAHSIGLASCWINREDAMFATERGKQLMQQFGLPEGLVGIGALALGYGLPEGTHAPKDRKADYYKVVK